MLDLTTAISAEKLVFLETSTPGMEYGRTEVLGFNTLSAVNSGVGVSIDKPMQILLGRVRMAWGDTHKMLIEERTAFASLKEFAHLYSKEGNAVKEGEMNLKLQFKKNRQEILSKFANTVELANLDYLASRARTGARIWMREQKNKPSLQDTRELISLDTRDLCKPFDKDDVQAMAEQLGVAYIDLNYSDTVDIYGNHLSHCIHEDAPPYVQVVLTVIPSLKERHEIGQALSTTITSCKIVVLVSTEMARACVIDDLFRKSYCMLAGMKEESFGDMVCGEISETIAQSLIKSLVVRMQLNPKPKRSKAKSGDVGTVDFRDMESFPAYVKRERQIIELKRVLQGLYVDRLRDFRELLRETRSKETNLHLRGRLTQKIQAVGSQISHAEARKHAHAISMSELEAKDPFLGLAVLDLGA